LQQHFYRQRHALEGFRRPFVEPFLFPCVALHEVTEAGPPAGQQQALGRRIEAGIRVVTQGSCDAQQYAILTIGQAPGTQATSGLQRYCTDKTQACVITVEVDDAPQLLAADVAVRESTEERALELQEGQ